MAGVICDAVGLVVLQNKANESLIIYFLTKKLLDFMGNMFTASYVFVLNLKKICIQRFMFLFIFQTVYNSN